MSMAPGLRSLRDHPFELLLEIERRARAAVAGALDPQAGGVWSGVAFRLGGETFLVPRDEVREIMSVPAALTRVPGAREWIRGLANVRGQLLPVIDLRQYLGAGVTHTERNSRVIVVNHREIPAGLLVDEVLGFRRFSDADYHAGNPAVGIRCERYLGGCFRRGSEAWPVLGLRTLIESPAFLQGSA